MEASGSPPKYRFILFYSLNLLAQFDKPYPNELWKISTSEDQTERKKTNPRHRDAKITQKRDFETHKNAAWISRSGQDFPSPTVFEVAFCSPTYWFLN